jgi:hypothetical protein
MKQTKSVTQWSQTYYSGLTSAQHKANNEWFLNMFNLLNEGGLIIVPNLGKTFTTDGLTFQEVA